MWRAARELGESRETLIPRVPHTRTFTLETFESVKRTVRRLLGIDPAQRRSAIRVGSRS